MSSKRSSQRLKMAGGSKVGGSKAESEKKRKAVEVDEDLEIWSKGSMSDSEDTPPVKKASKTIQSMPSQKSIPSTSKGKGKEIMKDSESDDDSSSQESSPITKLIKKRKLTAEHGSRPKTTKVSLKQKRNYVRKKLKQGKAALDGLSFLFNSVVKTICSVLDEEDKEGQAMDEAAESEEEEADQTAEPTP